MQQPYGLMRDIGATTAGFLAYVITHSDFDRWIGTLAGLAGLILVLLTIVEKLRNWHRKRKEGGCNGSCRRVPLILLAATITCLGMSACAGSPRKPVAVMKAAVPVARAEVLAEQSRARVRKVQARVETAREAVAVLRRTATPEQEPAIAKVEVALAESDTLLVKELDENIILSASLRKAQDGLTAVLLEQERIVRELERTQARAKAYWRLKLMIASLATLVAGWVAWNFVPVILGPWKLYAAGGAAAAMFTAVMLIL